MCVTVCDCCKNLIMIYFVRRIYNYFRMFRHIFTVLIIMKILEHTAVSHIVSVNNCIEIREIFAVYTFRINRAGISFRPFNRMVQIISVVRGTLHDRIVDIRPFDSDPCINLRIHRLQRGKINRNLFLRFRVCRLFRRRFLRRNRCGRNLRLLLKFLVDFTVFPFGIKIPEDISAAASKEYRADQTSNRQHFSFHVIFL